jgi:uncharacterized protein (DUF2336 family)
MEHALIEDLDSAIAHASRSRRNDHLERVTDLFLRDAPRLSDEQIDLFDVVIARLANAIEVRARMALSERLADVPNAPRGVVRSLAHDEISVARPILTTSDRLSDDDLVAVALAKGREHMLAISERKALTEPVTDVLVKRGDRIVAHAVAGNPGARFSEDGFAALAERARADDALRVVLSERDDVDPERLRQLMAIAKERARVQMTDSAQAEGVQALDHALEHGTLALEAEIVPGARDYRKAMAEIEERVAQAPLVEQDLAEYASAGKFEECVCAVAEMADLSIQASERLFDEGDAELLMVVSRAQDWAWPTLRLMLKLRGDEAAAPHMMRKAKETFEKLKPKTAERVLHFLKAREASQQRASRKAAFRTGGNIKPLQL